MTAEELQDRFGLSHSKSVTARITNCILGVRDNGEIEEFAKAGIKPKTIRLKRNGTPKEAMSFPSFDYFKLLERDFWRSDFYGYMQQKYLFVVFREDEEEKDVYRLASVMFWQMPDADLEEACHCYEQMRAAIRAGRAEDSVKSTETAAATCGQRERDGNDVRPQPYGEPVVKNCFWLNQKYLAGEIAKGLAIALSCNAILLFSPGSVIMIERNDTDSIGETCRRKKIELPGSLRASVGSGLALRAITIRRGPSSRCRRQVRLRPCGQTSGSRPERTPSSLRLAATRLALARAPWSTRTFMRCLPSSSAVSARFPM